MPLSIVVCNEIGPGYVSGESPFTQFVYESIKHQKWLLEDQSCQTTISQIYSMGDMCSKHAGQGSSDNNNSHTIRSP